VPDKLTKGREGELEAARVLAKKGYKILATNFRSPFGEIDIIAEDDGFLVFIEVKRRTNASFGSSLEAVDSRKMLHIIRSAKMYLKMNRCIDRRVRFDVVGIDGDTVKVIKHAFTE
jgi:putative endonuclease